MKKQDYMKLALVMAAAGTLMVATPSRAEDGTPSAEGAGGHHGGEMFNRADANKDGFLTREEMLKAHEARIDKMFADLDTSKDNKLSQDEMKAGRDKMRAKMKERMGDRHHGDHARPTDDGQ